MRLEWSQPTSCNSGKLANGFNWRRQQDWTMKAETQCALVAERSNEDMQWQGQTWSGMRFEMIKWQNDQSLTVLSLHLWNDRSIKAFETTAFRNGGTNWNRQTGPWLRDKELRKWSRQRWSSNLHVTSHTRHNSCKPEWKISGRVVSCKSHWICRLHCARKKLLSVAAAAARITLEETEFHVWKY